MTDQTATPTFAGKFRTYFRVYVTYIMHLLGIRKGTLQTLILTALGAGKYIKPPYTVMARQIKPEEGTVSIPYGKAPNEVHRGAYPAWIIYDYNGKSSLGHGDRWVIDGDIFPKTYDVTDQVTMTPETDLEKHLLESGCRYCQKTAFSWVFPSEAYIKIRCHGEEGVVPAKPGDWILVGVKSEAWPVKEAKTYLYKRYADYLAEQGRA